MSKEVALGAEDAALLLEQPKSAEVLEEHAKDDISGGGKSTDELNETSGRQIQSQKEREGSNEGEKGGDDDALDDEDQDYDDLAADNDSAIGDLGSYATSTYTVGSSIAEGVEENGRTYHSYKDGKYMLPNDEREMNRLDIQHKMWLITLGDKLHLAPIGPSPHRVLDIATGTGIWAVDFAEAYPSAEVVGTDLSLIQPEYVPPNCRFEIDDVEDDWIFPFKFDYIHGRCLATCFNNGADVIEKAFDALVPGGYLELQDFEIQEADDGSMEGTTMQKWVDNIDEAAAKAGRSWKGKTANYKQWLIEKGFEDVSESIFRWPSNQFWPTDKKEKLLGAWWQAQIDTGGLLESSCTRLFTTYLGWTPEELAVFLAFLRKDFRNPKIHAYGRIRAIYGRKPLQT